MLARRFLVHFLLILTLVVVPLVMPVKASAALGFEWTGACVGGSTEAGREPDVATIQGLECLLANVLNVFIALIGLAAFIMIIVASFRYLLSGGNTKGTEQARNTLTYAIVGIIVSLSAFIILNLLSAFTGVDLTTFSIMRDTTVIDNSGVGLHPGGGGR
ncbi:hypothetical protein KA012_00050 [Candidatus Woesebacteria bacterium]|nr:hypothetical protein [Candidatus Woesebacteria bacterium]